MKNVVSILFILCFSYLHSQNADSLDRAFGRIAHVDSEDDIIVPSNEKVIVYDSVSKSPSFPGGLDSLKDFIYKNLIYPKSEYEKGVSGVCVVGFTVSPIGILYDVKLLEGIKNADLCNKEAIRIVNEMPFWEPGEINGVKVDARHSLEIKFEIEK